MSNVSVARSGSDSKVPSACTTSVSAMNFGSGFCDLAAGAQSKTVAHRPRMVVFIRHLSFEWNSAPWECWFDAACRGEVGGGAQPGRRPGVLQAWGFGRRLIACQTT